ncbi:MAG: AzlC family ABC transporter permease [Jiangellaceae bacterium]
MTSAPVAVSAPRIELAAARDIVPVAASVVPFALVIGSAMREIGVPGSVGVLGGGALYAGSAHLAAVTLLGAGAEIVMILVAVAVINARLLVYGASLEPHFRDQPLWFRWLGPHFLVDQTYALATARDDLDAPARFRRYWLVAGLVLGAFWVVAMAAGMGLGAAIPASSPLNFAATAVIIALLAPRLRARGPIVVAGVAAVIAIAASGLPNGLGLGAGLAAGIVAGGLVERSGR